MKDSGTELAVLSKQALVVKLIEAVNAWSGNTALVREEDRNISSILDLIMRCTLLVQEQHWLRMCDHWLSEARRKPKPETRDQWLRLLMDWQIYTNESDCFANDPPA